jgi:putative ABC transport system permease protein
MNWLRTTLLRFRALFHKRSLEAEMAEEMRAHVEMQTHENTEAGMEPEEARFAALRQFGWTESIKEACRDQRGIPWLEQVLQDVRYGLRMLRKSPGFTAVAVLTLALGIGANTAIFSLINGLLLRPLPYPEPERLVTVCESNLRRGYQQILVAPANLRDWRERNSVFEELGGQMYSSLSLTGVEKPQQLNAAYTTVNYFSVLGVPPLLGRTFAAEDLPPGPAVAVLSYGLWQRCFGADRAIIGKPITLSGKLHTVVGVMPPGFRVYPPAAVFGLPTGKVQAELWTPYPSLMNDRTNRYFLGFARLKPGVTLAQARDDLGGIVDRIKREYPTQKDWGSSVQPLKEQIVGSARAALQLLLGAVGFVLLIACANVANLSLARAAGRRKEFAIRFALGALRFRLARQLLVESLLLALLGGAVGALLAYAGLKGFLAFQFASFPRLDEIRLDGAVLGFTLLISVLTGVIFGLAPAFQASRQDLNDSLKESDYAVGEGRGRRQVRYLLVVAEVALAMILLAGAGLLINSFVRLAHVSPGFEPEHLLLFDVVLPGREYREDAKRMSLVSQVRHQLQAQPGVKSVSTAYGLPFGTMLNSLIGVTVEGRPATEEERLSAGWRVVSPNYFETMQAPVLMGRTFSEKLDTANSTPVVIVNEAFFRKNLAGEDPLGKRIRLFPLSTNWHEIAGVIKDIKLTGLDRPAQGEVYQPDSQRGPWMFTIAVRSSLLPREIESMVRREVAALDKDLPLFNLRSMDEAITTSMASRRFVMMLVGLFAALALMLTAVGIYGVVAYTVSQRTREIGIRMALGASRNGVLRLMLRQGIIGALVGVLLGLAGSLALARLIVSQLFGVTPADPLTFLLVVVLLMLVAAAASYLPARRAAKVDPIVALRTE